jgi:hypothetical protein
MSVRYIEIGPWSVAVETDLAAIHDALELNFGRRYSTTSPSKSKTTLACRVISRPQAYRSAAETVVWNGPEVALSPGITIHYGFASQKTWLHVTQTGIIALDASSPTDCQVLLHPDAISSYTETGEPDPQRRIACPEAFLYPMLAEWVRGFGACLVHCGAVALHGRAIFLTGASGSGKSTQVLRMVTRGASFVADDLALLCPGPTGMHLMQLRDVANLKTETVDNFSELSHLRNAPIRGDGKYSINIPERFPNAAVADVGPGFLLRLHAGESPTMEPVPSENLFDGMYSMAWFGSRPESNRAHFGILTDWLFACQQWHVSRAYLRDHLDELMSRLGGDLENGGMA